jgi:hypothetical protein
MPTPYESFLEKVQPTAIALRSCRAVLDRPEYWRLQEQGAEKPESPLNTLKADYRLETVTGDSFAVVAAITVRVLETEESTAGPLEISCEFDLAFDGHSVTREHAEQFTRAELRLVAWPYFREFVSQVADRMSVLPVHLPLVLRSSKPSEEAASTPQKTKRSAPRKSKLSNADV